MMQDSATVGPQNVAAQIARLLKQIKREAVPPSTRVRAARRTRFPQEVGGSGIEAGVSGGELATPDATVTTATDETASWPNSRQWQAGQLSAVNLGTPGEIAVDIDSMLAVAGLPGTGVVNVLYWDTTDDTIWFDADGAGTWVQVGGGGGTGDVVGPPSAIDRRLALFDGTTGKLIRDAVRWGVTSGGILQGFDISGNVCIEFHTGSGQLLVIGSTSGSVAHGFKVFSEPDWRLLMLGDGSYSVGDGTAPPDTKLERLAGGLMGMASGDAFHARDFLGLEESAVIVLPVFMGSRSLVRADDDHQLRHLDGTTQTRDLVGNTWNFGGLSVAPIFNTAAKTQFAGGCVLQPNKLGVNAAGATGRIFASGLLRSFADPIADTLTWFITFTSAGGAVDIFASQAVPISAAFQGLLNAKWQIDARFTVTAVGAGGTVICDGMVAYQDTVAQWGPAGQYIPWPNVLIGAAGINTTLLQTATIGVQFNNASVANNISLAQFQFDLS